MLRVVALLLLLSPSLYAEEDARAYFEKATAQFALGKFAEAAINFEKCFELKPDPSLLYNAAQAQRLAGNKPRALQLYQSYVRIYGNRIDNRAEVLRHIENLKSAIEKDQQVATAPPIITKPPAPAEKPPAAVKPAPPVVVAKPAPPPVKPAPPPVKPAPPKPAPVVVVKPAPPPVKPAPVVVEPPPPVDRSPAVVVMRKPADKPLVKKGWFWGAVAGGVVVVAGAVALGVVFGTPSPRNPNPSFGTVPGN